MKEVGGSPIRVFLLDANPMMRMIFPEYLQEQDGIELCGVRLVQRGRWGSWNN